MPKKAGIINKPKNIDRIYFDRLNFRMMMESILTMSTATANLSWNIGRYEGKLED